MTMREPSPYRRTLFAVIRFGASLALLALTACGSSSPTAEPASDPGSSSATGTGAVTASAAAPDSPNRPRLGAKWASGQIGYGEVRPAVVFNGGDPTGRVTGITWESWGSPRAVGHGQGWFPSAAGVVADGHAAAVTIVAFQLATCQGVPAYLAVEWFDPAAGGAFDAKNYINDCSGVYATPTPGSPTRTSSSRAGVGPAACTGTAIARDLKIPVKTVAGTPECHEGWAVTEICSTAQCTDTGVLLHQDAGVWTRVGGITQDCLTSLTALGLPEETAREFSFTIPSC